jgi:predicted GNAT family acetyltransferase
MSTSTQDISMADRPEQERYEIAVDGELAGFVEYRERDGALDLVHTEVLPAFEGRGLAGRVAQFALDDARRQGRQVLPSCSYIARYIERRPELQDLLAGPKR